MAPSATPDINFAVDDELSGRPGGKFIRWALTYGKAVIVLTELVVVSLFISRFWLDARRADLAEAIETKFAIVESSAEFESRFRALVKRTASAKTIMTALTPNEILDQFKPLLPEGVQAKSITVTAEQIQIEGTSQTEEALAVLSRSFRDSAYFTNVDLRKVTKDADKAKTPGIEFNLFADFVREEGDGNK